MLDVMIDVFDAVTRGLFVPADARALQARIIELETKVTALENDAGGVIGHVNARRYILGPLRTAAQHTATARGEVGARAIQSARMEHERAVRMHVQFPQSLGQGWAVLPIERLGSAQQKVAEIVAQAQKESAPIIAQAKKLTQLSFLDVRPPTVALA